MSAPAAPFTAQASHPVLPIRPAHAAALLLAVALMHVLALRWASNAMQSIGFDDPPAAQPIYSRMIVPETPAPAAAVAAAPVMAAPVAPRAAPASKAVRNSAVKNTGADAAQPPAAGPPASAASTPVAPANAETPQATASAELPAVSAASAPAPATPANDALTGPASSWPPSTRISYSLTGYFRGDLTGSGSLEWRRSGAEGRDYQLRLTFSSLVSTEYRSRGKINGIWLQPERYEEQAPRGTTAVNFNRESGKLSFSSITDVTELPPNAQDTASTMMQVTHHLRVNSSQLREGYRMPVTVARPRGVDRWEFEVLGQETLSTPTGDLIAWHLKRAARKPKGDIGVDIWVAPQLQHLPVRIRLQQSEDLFLDLLLARAEQQ
jgi:hypothetical protein